MRPWQLGSFSPIENVSPSKRGVNGGPATTGRSDFYSWSQYVPFARATISRSTCILTSYLDFMRPGNTFVGGCISME